MLCINSQPNFAFFSFPSSFLYFYGHFLLFHFEGNLNANVTPLSHSPEHRNAGGRAEEDEVEGEDGRAYIDWTQKEAYRKPACSPAKANAQATTTER